MPGNSYQQFQQNNIHPPIARAAESHSTSDDHSSVQLVNESNEYVSYSEEIHQFQGEKSRQRQPYPSQHKSQLQQYSSSETQSQESVLPKTGNTSHIAVPVLPPILTTTPTFSNQHDIYSKGEGFIDFGQNQSHIASLSRQQQNEQMRRGSQEGKEETHTYQEYEEERNENENRYDETIKELRQQLGGGGLENEQEKIEDEENEEDKQEDNEQDEDEDEDIFSAPTSFDDAVQYNTELNSFSTSHESWVLQYELNRSKLQHNNNSNDGKIRTFKVVTFDSRVTDIMAEIGNENIDDYDNNEYNDGNEQDEQNGNLSNQWSSSIGVLKTVAGRRATLMPNYDKRASSLNTGVSITSNSNSNSNSIGIGGVNTISNARSNLRLSVSGIVSSNISSTTTATGTSSSMSLSSTQSSSNYDNIPAAYLHHGSGSGSPAGSPPLASLSLPKSISTETDETMIKSRKKIRHVQIQTRSPIYRNITVQTEPLSKESSIHSPNTNDTVSSMTSTDLQQQKQKQQEQEQQKQKEALEECQTELIASQSLVSHLRQELDKLRTEMTELMNENVRLTTTMDDSRVKFDRLSAQAYKKIKDLLAERQVMEIEIKGLKEQVYILEHLQLNDSNPDSNISTTLDSNMITTMSTSDSTTSSTTTNITSTTTTTAAAAIAVGVP